MNRPCALRSTLEREGYAETDGKYFRLRPKILELGFSALSSMTFSASFTSCRDERVDLRHEPVQLLHDRGQLANAIALLAFE